MVVFGVYVDGVDGVVYVDFGGQLVQGLDWIFVFEVDYFGVLLVGYVQVVWVVVDGEYFGGVEE